MIVPPIGYATQFYFKLTSGNYKTPNLDVTDFTYNLDITTSTGDGTLTLAADDTAYMMLRDGNQFNIYWGWSKDGNLAAYPPELDDPFKNLDQQDPMGTIHAMERNEKYIPRILSGYIKDIKRVGGNIKIDFFDKGVLLEQKASDLSWSNSALSGIITDIANAAGIPIIIDWADVPGINQQNITYPPPSATATASDSGTGGTAADATGTGTTLVPER